MTNETAPKKRSFMKTLLLGPEDPILEFFDSIQLRKSGELHKILGDNKGVQSLRGATIEFDDGAEISKRVTASRVLLTGVFALALKKKSGGEKWLLISGSEFDWMIEVPRKKQADAHKFYQALKKFQRELEREDPASDAK